MGPLSSLTPLPEVLPSRRIPVNKRNRSMPRFLWSILGLLAIPLVRADQNWDNHGWYDNQYNGYQEETFEWPEDVSFGDVSVLPVSCIDFNGGQMIKFELYKAENNYKCHFHQISSFVVSISHFMRAYFNYQAISNGKNFQLPSDAGYLNCVMLQETAYDSNKLYAKIGCMDRQTFTSTKLQLHVYTDDQCTNKYQDGYTAKRHTNRGYEINGFSFSTQVSFRPPFYSCIECAPEQVSDTFNKKNTNWYDDDYISQNGNKQENQDADEEGNDDAYDDADDYLDDAYMAANDDVKYNNDDAAAAAAGDDAAAAGDDAAAAGDDAVANDDAAADGDDGGNKYNFNDDYYKDDDGRMLRSREDLPELKAAPGQLEAYAEDFWKEVDGMRRLYDNYYDVGNWNMCNQMYNYGVWCNEDCQALDSFRLDEWSKSDIILITLMCIFMAAMMILIVAKRLRSKQKARMYGDSAAGQPGLSPFAVSVIFFIILTVIVTLAKLKFVNETLVFAVVTCILIFIYMLKLTLFERRRPVLLAAPKHDMMWDNPLDDRLFD